jgi:hypothetical protein
MATPAEEPSPDTVTTSWWKEERGEVIICTL